MPAQAEKTARPKAAAAPQRPPRIQAGHHRATRKAHALEVAEDYAETVSDLIQRGGRARVTDLARHMGVTHVTVVRIVARLKREGLLEAGEGRTIVLTGAGAALADKARRRHRVVLAFLRSLGVSEKVAQADAEGIEHHVSDATLLAMERFVHESGVK